MAGSRRRAPWLVMGVGAAAALVSCWPVVFGGRSFVTPLNGGVSLLYDVAPFVPGYDNRRVEEVNASDVGAMNWAFLPGSVEQHRAVFRDHELPLWNRGVFCGGAMLGQGASMTGDPLHWIPVLAGGTSGAWDVKFVLTKVLYAAGVGLLAWMAVGDIPSAALVGASSAYLGFFSFRINHS